MTNSRRTSRGPV